MKMAVLNESPRFGALAGFVLKLHDQLGPRRPRPLELIRGSPRVPPGCRDRSYVRPVQTDFNLAAPAVVVSAEDLDRPVHLPTVEQPAPDLFQAQRRLVEPAGVIDSQRHFGIVHADKQENCLQQRRLPDVVHPRHEVEPLQRLYGQIVEATKPSNCY